MRVWLSRCGIRDGEEMPVQVERLEEGKWIDVSRNEVEAGGRKNYYLDGDYSGLFVEAWRK